MRTIALLLLLAVAACGGEQSTAPKPGKQPASPRAASAAPGTTPGRTGVGDVMPPYAAKYLDGKPFDLASERGHVVLVNVWATWCGPCRFEIPTLQAMHDKYASRGLRVIGVSVDESGAEAVKPFVIQNKITYPIVLDADGRISSILRTTVLPTSVIVGRDGKIVWRTVGALMPNEAASTGSVIEKALAESNRRPSY